MRNPPLLALQFRLASLGEHSGAFGGGDHATAVPRRRAEQIEALEAIGVGRCVFFMPPEGTDTVLPRLRHVAEVCGV